MDYTRSDSLNATIDALHRKRQEAAQRRAALDSNRAAVFDLGGSRGFRSIIAAARLADRITDAQVLEIEQSKRRIEIKREDTFSLNCTFEESGAQVVLNDLGTERCGWVAGELVFDLQLPDNLDISHRLFLSPDGEQLRISTTVDSSSAPAVTMERYYFKFIPLPDNYSCEYTLSRGRVCQQSAPR